MLGIPLPEFKAWGSHHACNGQLGKEVQVEVDLQHLTAQQAAGISRTLELWRHAEQQLVVVKQDPLQANNRSVHVDAHSEHVVSTPIDWRIDDKSSESDSITLQLQLYM